MSSMPQAPVEVNENVTLPATVAGSQNGEVGPLISEAEFAAAAGDATPDAAASGAVRGDGGACDPTPRSATANDKRSIGRLPRLRLQQHGSNAGAFTDTASGMTFTRLDAIFLRMKIVRRLFAVDDDAEPQLRCWSDGGAMPSGEVSSPVAASCRDCPEGKWTGSDGAKKPPRCGQVVRSIVVAGTPPRLFEFDFAGMSAKPALTFHDAVLHSTLPALYHARVPIDVETRDRTGGGRYRAVRFAHWSTISDEEAGPLKALYQKVAGYPLLGRLDQTPLGL